MVFNVNRIQYYHHVFLANRIIALVDCKLLNTKKKSDEQMMRYKTPARSHVRGKASPGWIIVSHTVTWYLRCYRHHCTHCTLETYTFTQKHKQPAKIHFPAQPMRKPTRRRRMWRRVWPRLVLGDWLERKFTWKLQHILNNTLLNKLKRSQ